MRNMKTICAIRDVFRAMTNFEASFEQVYQITLNEAMILCALKCSSERMTATNLSKQTDLSPSHTSKMLRILEEKGLIVRTLGSCLLQEENGFVTWKYRRWKSPNY